jgi:hypothetical protein
MPKRPRNYDKEYSDYHGTKEQKKRRAQRNKARRKALKKGTVKKGDNKEVHHVNAKRKGALPKKTRVISKKSNRKMQPKRK